MLIKVAFVEVDDNKALNLGVQGDYTGFSKNFSQDHRLYDQLYLLSRQHSHHAGHDRSVGPFCNQPERDRAKQLRSAADPDGSGGNGGMYTIMGNDFTATLQAIATAGKAQMLSRPSILARDGQMAEIFVGQSVYLPSSVTLTSVGNSGSTVPSINGTYRPSASSWTSRRSSEPTAWCK